MQDVIPLTEAQATDSSYLDPTDPPHIPTPPALSFPLGTGDGLRMDQQ